MQFQALVSKKANMWRAIKVLLFSTGDSAQCFGLAYQGKESEKEQMCMIHLAVCLK